MRLNLTGVAWRFRKSETAGVGSDIEFHIDLVRTADKVRCGEDSWRFPDVPVAWGA